MNSKSVCFLISNNFTHDNRTHRQARVLVESGYKVTILCPLVSAKIPREEYVDGILVKRVLDDWLPTVPKCRTQFADCSKYMKKAIEERADIYISKDLDTLVYGFVASIKNKSKLVYNADEYWQDLKIDGLGPKTKIYYKIYFFFAERIYIRRANLVTTVNDALAGKMKSNLWLRKKPLVILNAPDPMKVVPNKHLTADSGFENKNIAIYVGIFAAGRGLENLILASKKMSDDIAVVLLGYGPLKEALKKLIIDEKLTGRVKILDPVPYSKLLSYISSAKVGVIPIQPVSTSYKYCLPNKFFEYILAGIPICSSNLPVLNGLIEKYGIGETFDPYKTGGIADVINGMVANEVKYDQYKENIKKAAKDLNWEHEKIKFVEAVKAL